MKQILYFICLYKTFVVCLLHQNNQNYEKSKINYCDNYSVMFNSATFISATHTKYLNNKT